MTTALQILTRAFAKDAKLRPQQIVTAATDLVDYVHRALSGLMAYGAALHPDFFSKQTPVNFAAGGWARPANAEIVTRIENAGGTRVAVVPYEQRAAEPGMPAVYQLGQTYYSAGNALDPTSGTLTFTHTKAPDALASTASAIDALWPSSYDELLVLEVAVYLLLRDGFVAEAERLIAERDRWLGRFVIMLEANLATVRRSYGAGRPTFSVAHLGGLLAGRSTTEAGT